MTDEEKAAMLAAFIDYLSSQGYDLCQERFKDRADGENDYGWESVTDQDFSLLIKDFLERPQGIG